jgi:hypothetical protein
MKTFVMGLAAIVTTLAASPAFAEVWVEEEEVRPPPPRVVEREVIVREPAWRTAWDECRMVVERRVRPDGTVVVRKVRRC